MVTSAQPRSYVTFSDNVESFLWARVHQSRNGLCRLRCPWCLEAIGISFLRRQLFGENTRKHNSPRVAQLRNVFLLNFGTSVGHPVTTSGKRKLGKCQHLASGGGPSSGFGAVLSGNRGRVAHTMLLLLLILLGAVASLATEDTSGQFTANGNEIIDGLLKQAKESDFIQKEINPVTIKHVELDNGKGYVENVTVYGLDSLARQGDVYITLFELRSATITGKLRAENLRMSCRYVYWPTRLFKLRGSLAATLDYITVEIGLLLDTEQKRANLTTFKAAEKGKITVTKFTGASFAFNWLGKFIINRILNGQSFSMSERLETSGKRALNRLLDGKEVSLN